MPLFLHGHQKKYKYLFLITIKINSSLSFAIYFIFLHKKTSLLKISSIQPFKNISTIPIYYLSVIKEYFREKSRKS